MSAHWKGTLCLLGPPFPIVTVISGATLPKRLPLFFQLDLTGGFLTPGSSFYDIHFTLSQVADICEVLIPQKRWEVLAVGGQVLLVSVFRVP